MAVEVIKGFSWKQLDFDIKQKNYIHWKLLLVYFFTECTEAETHESNSKSWQRSSNSLKINDTKVDRGKIIPIILSVDLSVTIMDGERPGLFVKLTDDKQ